MPVKFNLDDGGLLEWRHQEGKQELHLDEANVVAAAEVAAALRQIAEALSEIAYEIRNKDLSTS